MSVYSSLAVLFSGLCVVQVFIPEARRNACRQTLPMGQFASVVQGGAQPGSVRSGEGFPHWESSFRLEVADGSKRTYLRLGSNIVGML